MVFIYPNAILDLVFFLSKIDFGKPYLQRVKLVRKYELKGVAFVEGYDKTVSFIFYSAHSGNLSLAIEDLYQAKYIYDFFRKLFKEYANEETGMIKTGLWLSVEWNITKANQKVALLKIEKTMGSDWKIALRTIMSVYEKRLTNS